jgi:hypothetical protein
MSTFGISRNIPASQRHLILERAADISKWPGSRSIRSVVTQGRLRITYEGQGGYACLRIHPDDDLEQRLVAIDRLMAHDKEISAIQASIRGLHLECDFDPESGHWLDEDVDMPLWAWVVPEAMSIAYRNGTPEGVKGLIDRELLHSMSGGELDIPATRLGRSICIIRGGDSYGRMTMRRVNLFSIRTGNVFLSENSSKNYMKITDTIPDAVISGMEGRRVGDYVTHPLVHPDTVIKRAVRDAKTNGAVVDMWRQGAVLAPSPIRDLEDILAMNSEYERLRR